MGSLFGDPAVFEDEDLVRFLDGLETVGDDDNGATLEEIMEGNVDLLLREAVERAGRLVKNDDLGILDEYLGNGETLALSSGEPHSFFSNLGSESVPEIIDEVALREFDGFLQILLRHLGARSVREVLENGSVEYGRILGQVPDMSVIIPKACLGQVLSIHDNGSSGRMEISGNELHERGFPGSRESDKGGFLASGNEEGEVGEDGIIRIGIGEISKFYVSFSEFKGISRIITPNLRNIVEQIPEFFYGRVIFGEIFEVDDKIIEGKFQKCNHCHKSHKIRYRKSVMEYAIPDNHIYADSQ